MELLTVQEVADLLKVSSITVRRYIKSGLLTAVRIGRNVRVEREKVEKLVGEKASNDDDGGEYLPHLRQANLLHDAPVDTLERYHVDNLDIVVTEMDQTTATEKENAAWLERELATGMGVLTSRSSIWQHIGMFREPGQPDDVSENKSKYIAEAYMAKDA